MVHEENKDLVFRETEYITPSFKHLVLLKSVAYPLDYVDKNRWVGSSKMLTFVNVYMVENVNVGG